MICVDNFFTGSRENVKHLLDKPNFETIRHDVVEKLLLEVDQIYHLACPASPVHYKWDFSPSVTFSSHENSLSVNITLHCPSVVKTQWSDLKAQSLGIEFQVYLEPSKLISCSNIRDASQHIVLAPINIHFGGLIPFFWLLLNFDYVSWSEIWPQIHKTMFATLYGPVAYEWGNSKYDLEVLMQLCSLLPVIRRRKQNTIPTRSSLFLKV